MSRSWASTPTTTSVAVLTRRICKTPCGHSLPRALAIWDINTSKWFVLSTSRLNTIGSFNRQDCGWQGRQRQSNGSITYDASVFPDGILPLSKLANSLGFQWSMYTDQGVYSCDTQTPLRPGSLGYEKQDALQLAGWNVAYMKACLRHVLILRKDRADFFTRLTIAMLLPTRTLPRIRGQTSHRGTQHGPTHNTAWESRECSSANGEHPTKAHLACKAQRNGHLPSPTPTASQTTSPPAG